MRRPVHYLRPSWRDVMMRDLSKLGIDSVSDYPTLKVSINIAGSLKWICKKGTRFGRLVLTEFMTEGAYSDDILPGVAAAVVLEHSGTPRGNDLRPMEQTQSRFSTPPPVIFTNTPQTELFRSISVGGGGGLDYTPLVPFSVNNSVNGLF